MLSMLHEYFGSWVTTFNGSLWTCWLLFYFIFLCGVDFNDKLWSGSEILINRNLAWLGGSLIGTLRDLNSNFNPVFPNQPLNYRIGTSKAHPWNIIISEAMKSQQRLRISRFLFSLFARSLLFSIRCYFSFLSTIVWTRKRRQRNVEKKYQFLFFIYCRHPH